MLDANPLHVGAVYIEQDSGSDLHGDTFEVTFEGGAANTELTRLTISGDKGAPGLSMGDVFFDTAAGGLGADYFFGFELVSLSSQDPQAAVTATVDDGGLQLVLDFQNFHAGDKLVFSIDVDEAQNYDPAETDLALINEGFDPLTSGVEFQGSQLTASFSAPHFHDITGTGEFRNQYDARFAGKNLNLPADNAESKRDRSAGAVASLTQDPLPVSIAGTVYLDPDLDLQQDSGEPGLKDVELALWKKDGSAFAFTGHKTKTNANGDYKFGLDLNLKPGTYQVRETQPSGLFSVGAVAGTVAGSAVGSKLNNDPNILTEINIPLGDQHAIDYDFAEAQPAALSGYVYHDRSNEGARGTGEEGLAGVSIQVIPVSTVAAQSTVTLTTDANGFYSATGLAPGTYRVVETAQPAGYFDGLDAVGTVAGQTRGTVNNPGDSLEGVLLGGGQAGVEYNFGEIAPASISGHVELSDPDGNCFEEATVRRPIANVTLRLLDAQSNVIAETKTNAHGEYSFTNLLPGRYSVVEVTPAGLIDGDEHIGKIANQTVGTVAANDVLGGIVIGSGQNGVRYDFCEYEPASVAGFVYHDANHNGVFDSGEEPIGQTAVTLRGANGNAVASTTTGNNGGYSFAGLRAGSYSIVESQPGGWIDGKDTAGRIGGSTVGVASNDRIDQVQLKWGDHGVHYDFGELRPVSISGHVYHDRGNDGTREPGDEGIAGVRLQVVPVNAQSPQAAVTVITDSAGFYEATGLAPGEYRVVEEQPSGYQDGIDVVGTVSDVTRGTVTNPGDAISAIVLASGEQGVQYNFGEYKLTALSGRVTLTDKDGNCAHDESSEFAIEGVLIELLNADGVAIAETHTDANGEYEFAGLLPGTYTIVEHTPAGLIDHDEHVGTVNGQENGTLADDRVSDIQLTSGQRGVHYDFCEAEPSSLSGNVYHDHDDNGAFEPGEDGIGAVQIILQDADGNQIASTTTAPDGSYSFTGLRAGTYRLVEVQPNAWRDGQDTLGEVNGVAVGTVANDQFTSVTLRWGDHGESYNFGEILDASITGTVFVDPNQNCLLDPGETLLQSATVQLLNQAGDVIATTTTDEHGHYEFTGLTPGTYSVREQQPSGYFQGGQVVGTGTGNNSVVDLLSGIVLFSGDHVEEYNFCELPPAKLSGYVFQDGAAIKTEDGEPPADLPLIRNGQRTPDDTPLAGVVLELRDGRTGLAIDASRALPGLYPAGPIRTTTDANGFYQFTGLLGGRQYAVYEIHPDGYVDSIDTPGTTHGQAFNVGQPVGQGTLEQLAEPPRNDAIVRIPLAIGQVSENNNFSEVIVQAEPEDPLIPSIPRIPPQVPPISLYIPPLLVLPSLPGGGTSALPMVYGGGTVGGPGLTWHLSVINAGQPRDLASANEGGAIWRQARYVEYTNWQADRMREAQWTLAVGTPAENAEVPVQRYIFGVRGGLPVTGDFNGDGLDEIAIYYQGEWFIDLNGNGYWDEDDLWAELGTEGDLPVTGDWDGDGKDDIGVFGPEWPGDPRAISTEPGLPDQQNRITRKMKNMPPPAEEATDGQRLLQLNAGGPRRVDVIDHVFRFGQGKDVPVAGDWNGDGIRSIGVFSDGIWQLDVDGDGRWAKSDAMFAFGQPGDIPIVGDFDGNGVDEIGVYRQGQWILDVNRNRELDAHDKVFAMGEEGDLPVVGDWNGDGKSDPGLYRDGVAPQVTPVRN